MPQDKLFASEYFSKYSGTLKPGLNFVGLDCCGACVTFKSISTRVQQIRCVVPTKTKDDVFVQVVANVQLAAVSGDALYKLNDVPGQVNSYVSDLVRSEIPRHTLEEAFEIKETIAVAVHESLSQHFGGAGFQIHRTLITELSVHDDVMRSMNEVNKQRRLKEAAEMQAEAQKIRTIKLAEAEADAAFFSGQGIARERSAIIDGLRESIAGTGKKLSTEEISQLLLTTQFFETLKVIGTKPTCRTFYIPDGEGDDLDIQIRTGLLQGTAALEHMSAAIDSARPHKKPPQQTMNDSAHSPRGNVEAADAVPFQAQCVNCGQIFLAPRTGVIVACPHCFTHNEV